MSLEYVEAPDVKRLLDKIIDSLDLFHVVPQFVYCYRSKGSKSSYTIARIHGLGRIWQEALRRPPAYVIEVLSERYDRLSEEEKESRKGELEDKIAQLQEFDRNQTQDLRKNRDEKVQEIFKDINKAIDTYAKKNGLTFVFDKRALVYQDESLDITKDILKILNK